MACFCDGAIKDIDPLSGAHLGLRRRKRNFIRCKHPAYPYTVVTSVDIEPLEAMTFQGCAIDDVRKLHDPDLRALKRPGNPVQTYSARGVACARIPIKMTGDATDADCDRSPAADAQFRVYCVDSSGASRGYLNYPMLVKFADSVCHTSAIYTFQ
eukprot:GEMP01093541.1.p1 GENE.GEMP01093541.1~~GEMP01093541.1.p1  ORF type:complete len:155 (+),score=35.61 GEMP01093541.1:244-708(+)